NGRDAIEQIEEFAPDVVLADVFMPQMYGYEVCEYIKQNQKLRHIPVMLLVGSFEPFDEAEARRVGANDTLTKPFQSIRRLIDKVGLLVDRPEPEAPTAELPKADVDPELEKMSKQEIEITTADTQPLPAEPGDDTQEWALAGLKEGVQPASDTKVGERKMEINATETRESFAQDFADDGSEGDILLDLGDYDAKNTFASDEESLLDIDFDEVPRVSVIESALPSAAV